MEESHSSKKKLFAVAFAALAVVGVAVVIIKLRSVDSRRPKLPATSRRSSTTWTR